MQVALRLLFVVATWLALSAVFVWIPFWWLWHKVAVPAFGLPTLTIAHSVGLLALIWLAIHGRAKISVKVGNSD